MGDVEGVVLVNAAAVPVDGSDSVANTGVLEVAALSSLLCKEAWLMVVPAWCTAGKCLAEEQVAQLG